MRWRHEIGVVIQRRKAAMVRAVIPRAQARQDWLQRGHCASGAVQRLPSLQEEG